MYPEDEVELPTTPETSRVGGVASVGAILIGWIIASGLALLINFIVASISSPSRLGIVEQVVLFLAGPLGVGVGSYVAVGVARRNPMLLGGLVGLFTLPLLALYATHWVEVKVSFLSEPRAIVISLLTVLAGIMSGRLNYMLTQDTGWKEQWRVRGWEDLLYQDLLRKVRFNGSIADRLIDYERQQDPNATRSKLIQNAIERWESDNR